MPRIRTVKPELWTDEDFIDLTVHARLMFVASLNFADDYGVLPDKPRTLAARCLPADQADAVALIDELVKARFYVRRLAPNGDAVLVIRTFAQHQKIDKRTKGRWGDPSEWDSGPNRNEEPPIPPHPAESPRIPPENSQGREGKGKGREGKGGGQSSEITQVGESTGCGLTDPRFSQIVDLATQAVVNKHPPKSTDPQRQAKHRATIAQDITEQHTATISDLLRRFPDGSATALAQRITEAHG